MNTSPPNFVDICIFKDRIHLDGQVDRVEVVFYWKENGNQSLAVVVERLCNRQWATYTSEHKGPDRSYLTFDAITQLVNDIAPVLVATTVCKHGI